MAHDLTADCIAACNACADACDHCSTACLQEPEIKPMARCIALDIDCAALCRLAAACLARGSEFARRVCGLCALVCDACAEECAQHGHDHCRHCALACKTCAEACRRMVAV
ncbi:MAG TPA: four-helix bundle copper-binding protein [Roseateles sp.]